jgi:hypothetical protein
LPVTLHEGANAHSAVTHFVDGGALVAGGGTREAPVAAMTFLDASGAPDDDLLDKSMVAARADAAIADLDDTILVAGGVANADATFAEIVVTDTGASEAIAFADGARFGATLFVVASSDTAFDALLIGGEDELGEIRTDTVWIHSAMDTVTAQAGPEWTNARRGAAFARARDGGYIAGGEGPVDVVEHVEITLGAMPVIATFGNLSVARAGASAFAIPEGPLYIGGGRTAEGPSGDVEICFPEAVGP